MKNLVRYVAVGLAIGLTTSLVFASWVFAGSFATSRSVKLATPEILAQVLTSRSETRARFEELAPDLASRPDDVAAFAQQLADRSEGYEALIAEVARGGEATAGAVAAVTAEAGYLASLGALLGSDPFAISQADVDEVLRKNGEANALLGQETEASGIRIVAGDPLAWDPGSLLAEAYRTSQALRLAASQTELVVTGKTQHSVTVIWRAPDVADWSGIWITAGDAEPVFVTSPRYRIDGLDPLETIEVTGELALGSDGRFRGASTDIVEATSDHPPYAQAWLGDQTFSANFRVTAQYNYRDIYAGQTDYGYISVESSCASGACQASLDLSDYDLAFSSTSSGLARASGGDYVLTQSNFNMGYVISSGCDLYGTRTIRFRVTDGEMIAGIWTATELVGTVNHVTNSCGVSGWYVNSSFTASIFYGE